MWRVLFAGLLVMTCATGATAGPLEDAFSALQRGDHAQAAELFRPLAEQGDARAQAALGMLYGKGQGVPQRYREAAKWLHLAAAQGDAQAQYTLGWLYAMGFGVRQNDQESVKWYRKAAEQGLSGAQFNLGLMYDKGYGVPQDFLRAHMWYSLSEATFSGKKGKPSMKNRDRVVSQMTPTQMEKAQAMVRRCQETMFKECD